FGAIYYGSTGPAMAEALDALSWQGIYVNALRLRSFPFQDEIFDFVASHSRVFVIEQNRDAQLKTLLVNDAGINPASLISVLHHPTLPKNKVGYPRRDYEGKVSTLCAGCGHDSISAALIQAFFELDILPHRVAKLSGIGCSSKTPDYFLGNSHGFNTVHGRMPSVLTGANLANRELIYLGVSGDGDSASIGLGQFAHVMRRGVNMTYILQNNGVYG